MLGLEIGIDAQCTVTGTEKWNCSSRSVYYALDFDVKSLVLVVCWPLISQVSSSRYLSHLISKYARLCMTMVNNLTYAYVSLTWLERCSLFN